ncbi:MAG: hypothetical protein GY716_12300 [bacterium]|nr:hypothetical protein [bacterium]
MSTRPIARFFVSVVLALVVLLSLSPPSRAASDAQPRYLDDKFIISIGGFLTDFKTDASVGAGGVFGTSLRLEDELGVDSDQSVFRTDGLYRFNERHSLGFGYWSLNRDGLTEIDETIEFDGNVYELGAEIATVFDTDWVRVDWRYSLVRSERGEAGFSAGLSIYDFQVGLAGEATLGGGGTEFIRAEEELLAPVPTIGLFIHYAIKPKLLLHFEAEYLDLELGDLEGTVTDTSVSIEWYFTEHFGAGIGSSTTDIEVTDAGDDPFSVDYRQSGLNWYLIFAF